MSAREKGNLPAMTPRSAVELINDSKLYQEAAAVEGIDLRILTASYCCALGPSSCGKTTTLRIIAGHELGAPSGANPFGSTRAGMSVGSSLRSARSQHHHPARFHVVTDFVGWHKGSVLADPILKICMQLKI